MEYSLTLHNDVQELSLLTAFIDAISEENGIDMMESMNINLSVEEAVVNVMKYAYQKGATGEVRINATAADGLLTIAITDDGSPFDPSQKEDPDVSLPVEERPIGGLGIFLVRQLMDSVAYQRADGKNILTLTKIIK